MKTKYLIPVFIIPIILFVSCKKEKDDYIPVPTPVKETNLIINIGYNVDGESVIFDTIRYENQAGNQYSISRLHYYLSGFKFIKNDGTEIKMQDVFYIDIRNSVTNKLTFKNFPVGDYTSIEFLIGLDSANNITGALPNTIDNINMAWPEPMGGGYHFMKLEGHFNNGLSSFGYAMHLGLNPYLVETGSNKIFTVNKDVNNNINLNMNINEWYKNPFIYDFNIDGNYSMGNMAAMTKLADNGKDVFNEQ